MKLENCPGKEVPVRVDFHAQANAVMEEGADRQADRHSDIQKCYKAIEFLLIPEEIVKPRHDNVDEPQEIGDNEILAKRDLPVEIGRHIMKRSDTSLQPEKPRKIERQI